MLILLDNLEHLLYLYFDLVCIILYIVAATFAARAVPCPVMRRVSTSDCARDVDIVTEWLIAGE